MKISIYKLINPIDNSIFYVGATNNSLEQRLSVHISFSSYQRHDVIGLERKKLIQFLLKRDLKPIIQLIEDCDFELVNEREKYWYDYYANSGCKLIQSPASFHYETSAKVTESETADKIVLRFTKGYEWLKSIIEKDKTDSGRASTNNTILNALSEHYKKQKK